jgi:hypothetical protein
VGHLHGFDSAKPYSFFMNGPRTFSVVSNSRQASLKQFSDNAQSALWGTGFDVNSGQAKSHAASSPA